MWILRHYYYDIHYPFRATIYVAICDIVYESTVVSPTFERFLQKLRPFLCKKDHTGSVFIILSWQANPKLDLKK